VASKTYQLPDNRTATLTAGPATPCPPEYSAYIRALEKRVEVLKRANANLIAALERWVVHHDVQGKSYQDAKELLARLATAAAEKEE
jgi:hypothetical protein